MEKFWRVTLELLSEVGDDASLTETLADTELKHGDTGEDVVFQRHRRYLVDVM